MPDIGRVATRRERNIFYGLLKRFCTHVSQLGCRSKRTASSRCSAEGALAVVYDGHEAPPTLSSGVICEKRGVTPRLSASCAVGPRRVLIGLLKAEH